MLKERADHFHGFVCFLFEKAKPSRHHVMRYGARCRVPWDFDNLECRKNIS
jgi:hypothetical protein